MTYKPLISLKHKFETISLSHKFCSVIKASAAEAQVMHRPRKEDMARENGIGVI